MQDGTDVSIPASSTPERPPVNPVRKEAMLREDQVEQLARLRRAVAGRRRRRSERITDNLLLRLAVDHLLADADKLSGDTEQELWESLSKQRRRPSTGKKKY